MIQTHFENLFMTRSAKKVIFGFKVDLYKTVNKFFEPLINLGFKIILPFELMVNVTFGLLMAKMIHLTAHTKYGLALVIHPKSLITF